MGSILVVGEALVDIVVRQDGTREEHPGGSPLNVAIGLGRLGHDVDLLTRIGSDARGRSILDHLTASGVHLAGSSLVPGPTSTATARLAPDGSATYAFDLEWSLPPVAQLTSAADGDGPLALHTGSIAAVLEPGAGVVAELVSAHAGRVTTTYDPNLRPDLMHSPDAVRERVETLVAASDLVKLSDEDAAWLEVGTDPEALAERWAGGGPAVVVLTKGGGGMVGFCAAGRVSVQAPPVTVADTVGAGDSAMAELLDALADHRLLGGPARPALAAIDTATLRDVLQRAVLAAAITVARPGADPPSRAELAEALSR